MVLQASVRSKVLRVAGLFAILAIACAPCCTGLSTSNDKILDENGQELKLMGANWFGFNNGATMVLSEGAQSNGFAYDFATIVYRWQLLGFNAIRIPFSMQDLYFSTPLSITSTCALPTFADIAYSVTDPEDVVPSYTVFPTPTYWPVHTAMTCNGYLPNDSTLNRFIWVVQYMANNGFYVVIDDHSEDPTVVNNKNQFVQYWADIVTQISQDSVASQRLIVDILNEPDSRGWGWNTTGNLYLRVMDAIYAINPQVLFMVEGSGQGPLNGACWGDGFQTTGVVNGSANDPNPFLQALFGRPYLNQVAISPHVYGPAVTLATSGYSGAALFQRLSDSFGHLTKGYSYNGMTKQFPVVIGEVGSFFTNPGDLQFLADFQAYLLNTGSAADGRHNAIPNILYWCWNENSADTGGLVDTTWYNLLWVKIRWLNALGLKPWYKTMPPAAPPPSARPPLPFPPPRPATMPFPPSVYPPPSPPMKLSPPPRPKSSLEQYSDIGLVYYSPSAYAARTSAGTINAFSLLSLMLLLTLSLVLNFCITAL